MTTQKSERENLHKMLDLKTDNWIEACKDIDALEAEVERLVSVLSKAKGALISAKNAFEKNCAIDWDELDVALQEIEKIGGEK